MDLKLTSLEAGDPLEDSKVLGDGGLTIGKNWDLQMTDRTNPPASPC